MCIEVIVCNVSVIFLDKVYVHSLHVRQVAEQLYFSILARGRHCGAERAIRLYTHF